MEVAVFTALLSMVGKGEQGISSDSAIDFF